MKKLLGIVVLGLLLSGNAYAGQKEFNNWLNSFELSKPIVQDNIYYMGISYDGKPNKLQNIFAILISMINEDVYSEDKRYFTRYGCKPRDCGNKGFLWIDLKKKVAIGVITHSFWGEQDFTEESNYKKGQIFIFSNFFKDSKDFPDEFMKTYSEWIKKAEIEPSFYRFLNSKNELKEISQIK